LFSVSKSPAPQLSERLGEALKSRLSQFGSMEYGQTWKQRVTPLGLRYWAHTVSARPISGSGCTGSPTPRANDAEKRGQTAIDPRNGLVSSAQLAGHPTPNCPTGGPNTQSTENHTGGADLEGVANLAGYPTPNTPNGGRTMADTMSMDATGKTADGVKHTASLEHCSKLAGHPSPRAEDSEQTGAHRGEPDTLNSCSRLAGHATPQTHDVTTRGNTEADHHHSAHDLSNQSLGATTASTDTSTAKTAGFRLNPGFSLWLMIGIPTIVGAWASCGVRAMLSCRKSRRSL
jgi:hypothetical protein